MHVTQNTEQPEISPGETFYHFRHLLSLARILSVDFFIKDCIVDMETFTTSVKILSLEIKTIHANIAGLGKNFIQQKFSAIRYQVK